MIGSEVDDVKIVTLFSPPDAATSAATKSLNAPAPRRPSISALFIGMNSPVEASLNAFSVPPAARTSSAAKVGAEKTIDEMTTAYRPYFLSKEPCLVLSARHIHTYISRLRSSYGVAAVIPQTGWKNVWKTRLPLLRGRDDRCP